MESSRKFKIKFVNGEPDSIVDLATTKSVQHLISQLKHQLGTIKHIRLIASGQEVLPETRIADIPGDTLHCIVSQFTPQGKMTAKKTQTQGYFEWLETLDPGIVLMWICGLVLFAFWTLFFYQRDLFEESNVAILTLLTLGFLFPCFSVYVSGHDTPHPSSISVSNTGMGMHRGLEAVSRPAFEDLDTPPRPEAPLRRGGF